MSDVMVLMDGGVGFDALLGAALKARRDEAEAPAGLVQRLQARLAQAEMPKPGMTPRFAFAQSVQLRRSAASVWAAIGGHAVVLAVLCMLAMAGRHQPEANRSTSIAVLVPSIQLSRRATEIGGGGGAHDVAPVALGKLPQLAQQQIVPPKAPPMNAPRLAIDPTVIVQPDLKIANNAMPNLGIPNAPAASMGSLGTGSGGGIGSGSGAGIGPGSGGNAGGGVFHIGGGVLAPKVIFSVDPEYSEEARKAKFTGNVIVEMVVDERGVPSHVHVVQGAGMGLDEKAVDAVSQYRFKPATKDGKPVKVEMDVEVGFQIF